MKKLALLMAAAALFAFAGCDDDPKETPNYAPEIAGTYNGYTKANSKMFTDRIADEATLTITANEDGTVDIAYVTKDLFNTLSVENATIGKKDGTYIVAGTGVANIGMDPTKPSNYPFTVAGNIMSKTDASVTFTMTLGETMGETTVEFITGSPE